MTDDKTMNSTAWVKSTMDSLEIPPDHVSDTLSAPPTLPKPLPKGSRLPNHFDTVKDFITETDEKAEERQGTPEHTVHDIIEPYMDELDQLLLEPDMTTERAHFLVSAYANIKRTIDQPFHEKMSTHGLAIAADEQLKARLHPQKQLHPFQQDSVGRMKHLEQTIGGAMLCDDMGLGKTLQIIALIVANPVKTTLVVVPPTIIEQWQKALDENVTGLRTFSYYREGRTSTFDDGYQSSRKTSLEIADYDVVLTSYNILSMEYVAHVDFQERMSKLREGVSAASPARGMCALFDVPWGRMVLDEAHRIRNTDTVLHKSACLLTAEYRIFCTGTPFQNTYASVYAAFKFLRLHPWNNKSTFENFFMLSDKGTKPRSVRDEKKLKKHQVELFSATLRGVMIRRKVLGKFEDSALTPLKKIERDVIVRVKLEGQNSTLIPNFEYRPPPPMADDPVSEADCQEKTRMQWDPTKRALKEKYGDGIDPKKRLGLYTDARLTAIHYRLPQANYRDTVETRDVDIMAIQQEQLEATSEITASDVQTMFEDMSISAPKRKKAAKNPFLANLQKTQRDEFLAWLEIGDNWKSSKMVKLVQILAKILKVQNFAYDDECRGSAIVFADFLCALDVARVALRKSEGTKHLAVYEYSGDMAPKVRQQQLDDFRAHGIDNPAVLLMTAPCGSEGLEVTNATWVVFLNPCWNPHVELQCVSRAHRIGQLGRVSIVHIVARDSIEDRVVEKQDAKTDKAKELLELYTLEEYNGWTTRLSFEFVRSQLDWIYNTNVLRLPA